MNSTLPLYVYIMARGHSGSTMLELLLNRNKNITAVGEIDMFGLQIFRNHETRWQGVCSCGERPQYCSLWSDIISTINKNYHINLLEEPLSWPISDIGLEEEYGWNKPVDYLRYRYHRAARTLIQKLSLTQTTMASRYKIWANNRDFLVSSIAQRTQTQVIVDASKDPLQVLDIHTYSKLPFKILFLTRDVRGLAWSALKNGRCKNVAEEATSWARQNRRMLNYLNKLPKNLWTNVKYENLCSDTESELERIHEFLGIPNEQLSSQEEFSKRHTIAGNKTRFSPLDTIREDNKWRDNLNEKQLLTIRSISKHVASDLSYDV